VAGAAVKPLSDPIVDEIHAIREAIAKGVECARLMRVLDAGDGKLARGARQSEANLKPS
jgi:hypothetical protein